MIVAAVRIKGNREFIGIFWGASLAVVFDLVDEHLDPYRCEYLSLPMGGVHFGLSPESQMPSVPFAEGTEAKDYDDATVNLLPSPTFSHSVLEHIEQGGAYEGRIWKSFK